MKTPISYFAIVAFAATLLFSSCSASTNSASQPESNEASSGKEPVTMGSFDIEECLTNFSEGRAWVSYYDDDHHLNYGFIDSDGILIWSIAANEIPDWGYVEATEFQDGYSCLHATFLVGMGSMPGREGNPGMIVLDRDGHVVFSSQKPEDEGEYYFMGYGNNTFLAAEKLADFSRNSSYICEIDSTGKVVSRCEIDANTLDYVWNDYRYIGDGVFYGTFERWVGDDHAVYNRNTKSFIQLGDFALCDKLTGGETITNYNGRYYPVTEDDLSDASTWESFTADRRNKEILAIQGVEEKTVSDGLVVCILDRDSHDELALSYVPRSRGIYDYSGGLVAALPDAWDPIDADGFSGGYAAVQLRGADGNTYVTIVDKAGAAQYDPVKVDSGTLSSWKGYLSVSMTGKSKILDQNGNETSFEALDALGEDYKLGGRVVRGGFHWGYSSKTKKPNSFIGADGTEIHVVSITAESNKQTVGERIQDNRRSNSEDDGRWTLGGFSDSLPKLSDLTLEFNDGKNLDLQWGWSLFDRDTMSPEPGGYDANLAKAAIYLCEGTYHGEDDAKSRMHDLGFSDTLPMYYGEDGQTNTSPMTVASSVVSIGGEDCLVVAVAVRGTNDLGDFVTDARSGLFNVDGFSEAGETGMAVVREYCESRQSLHGIDPDHTILFVTGHSLGAAVAGQIAGNLEGEVAERQNIFAYTFASPFYETHGKKTGDFTNIHNVVNTEDAVPKFPLGGERYGVDHTFKGKGKDVLDQHMLDTYLNGVLYGVSGQDASGGFSGR